MRTSEELGMLVYRRLGEDLAAAFCLKVVYGEDVVSLFSGTDERL